MPRMLLTVHGVGTLGNTGGWQESVFKVISPHFECREINYPQFRWMGLLLTVIEPWALFIGFPVAGLICILRGLDSIWAWGAVATALWLSLALPFVRRRLTVDYFLKRFVKPLRLRPNVIAHSLGTYLIGSALQRKRPPASVNYMILAGCVLPIDYPWQRIYQSRPSAFEGVRNEVGRLDAIPWLAHIASKCGLLPGFGMAGLRGFLPVDGFVHTIGDPNTICQDCKKNGASARVHNVVGEFGHNGALSAAYAAAYWLPWLWSVESDKYAQWIEICLTANEHYQDKNGPKLRIAEEELLEWRRSDSNGETLRDMIGKFIAAHRRKGRIHGNVTAQVLCRLYRDVAKACRAHQERPAEWKTAIRSLNPEIAVARAVDKVLG